MRFNSALLNHTISAATLVLKFDQPADNVLSYYFRNHTQLGMQDRAFVAETIYTLLRRKRSLEYLCGDNTPRYLVLTTLCKFQGMSLRELQALLTADEIELVKKIKATPLAALPFAEQVELPDWLIMALRATMPDAEIATLAASLNQPGPLDLRVNAHLARRDQVMNELSAENEVEVTPYSPLGIRLKRKIALNKHPLFLSGKIEVQDEGSQLLGYLMAPKRGEMIVDFCAGAGGKTLMLGAEMHSQGRLYAFDVAEKRLQNLKLRLKRAGLSNIHPQWISNENDLKIKRLRGKIDRVLVDAPCSGLGTLRRNPDLKWRQTPATIAEIGVKQHAILNSAAKLLKPGGRLVYATCSILPEENEVVIRDFLNSHPEFKTLHCGELLQAARVPLDMGEFFYLNPRDHGTDGFFAATLQRT